MGLRQGTSLLDRFRPRVSDRVANTIADAAIWSMVGALVLIASSFIIVTIEAVIYASNQ